VKTFIALFLWLGVVCAANSSVIFSWTLPTTREDGSQILLEELSHVTLYVSGASGSNYVVDLSIHDDSHSGTYPVDSYAAHMTATDTGGLVSEPSASVSFVISEPVDDPPVTKPNRPNLSITCEGFNCRLVVN
jgi:hypothetical protein